MGAVGVVVEQPRDCQRAAPCRSRRQSLPATDLLSAPSREAALRLGAIPDIAPTAGGSPTSRHAEQAPTAISNAQPGGHCWLATFGQAETDPVSSFLQD
jgi:hypothetical protein